MKRIFSVTLVAVLLCSMLAVNVGAYDIGSVDGTPNVIYAGDDFHIMIDANMLWNWGGSDGWG